jgi:general stress protein CsbA
MRPPLHGMDSDVWGHNDDKSARKHHAPDLTAVRTRQIEDPFTKLVMTTLIKPFFNHIGRHFKKVSPMLGVAAYADESMRNFTRFVATFLASTMLLASINALYFISSMVVRLGAISAFNIVFALCLMVFAKARPIEVFSTTSA